MILTSCNKGIARLFSAFYSGS